MVSTLNRKMFSALTHNHKSTGIASGLEYRPGYRVGGRVGLKNGGDEEDAFRRAYLGLDVTDRHPNKANIGIGRPKKTIKSINRASLFGDTSGGAIKEVSGDPNLAPVAMDEGAPSRTAEDIFLERRELMDKYYTPIDYSKFNRSELDSLGAAGLDYLKKIQQPIPAGTLGSPSPYLQFATSIGDARAETRAINEANELMQLSVDNEQTLAMINDASKQAEILRLEGRTDEAAAIEQEQFDAELKLGYAQISNQLEIAGMQVDQAAQAAKDLLTKQPEKMKIYQQMLESGKTSEEALDIAFQLYNSKLDVLGIILDSYKSQIMSQMITPEDALDQALAQARLMFGANFAIASNDLPNLQFQAGSMDPGMSGYSTINQGTEIPD